jgi:predicted Zn-dependent protease
MIIADYRQGTESLNQAFKIAQRFQNSENPVFLDTLGWLDYLLNKSDRAIDTLERAVNKAPNVSQGHYHLAMAYLAKNRIVA